MISPDNAVSICQDPTRDEVRAHLEKILNSPPFRTAELNRTLLTFLTAHMLDRSGHRLKESEIAISVFHRDANSFDPQSDSIVRVQMTRLRVKLREYYTKYGEQDQFRFEIPKGSHQMLAALRPVIPEPEMATPAPADSVPLETIRQSRVAVALWISAAVALLAAGAGTEWIWQRASSPALPPHLAQFWRQVVPDQGSNLIVFSNPRLAGRLYDGTLRYYDPHVDDADPGSENLTYTGSGDVPAVSALTHVFYRLGRDMKVRSGATLSWEQAKESSLIFVGRPEQNPSLRMLPRLNEFNFRYHLGIVDSHPPPGGRSAYNNTPHPYTHDSAIIAFLPGLSPGKTTLILAGTVTYGSQAAAEFVCNENEIASLLDRLNVKPGGKIPFFEALIEVRINHDVPVWSHLEFARPHPPELATWQPLSPEEQ